MVRASTFPCFPLPMRGRAARRSVFDVAHILHFCCRRLRNVQIDCAGYDGGYHDDDHGGKCLCEKSNPAMRHI